MRIIFPPSILFCYWPQLRVAALPTSPKPGPRGPPLGLRLGAGGRLAYGESPSLCPSTPRVLQRIGLGPRGTEETHR